jgi:hypothetical protein
MPVIRYAAESVPSISGHQNLSPLDPMYGYSVILSQFLKHVFQNVHIKILYTFHVSLSKPHAQPIIVPQSSLS